MDLFTSLLVPLTIFVSVMDDLDSLDKLNKRGTKTKHSPLQIDLALAYHPGRK
jgi:hypothetical protein